MGHLYFNAGDLEQAEKMYRQALYFGPDYVHATAGLARVQAAGGRYREAIDAYKRCIDHLPLPEGEFAEAQRYIKKALRLGTRDASLYYHAGMIYGALGNAAQAETMLATALSINPHFNIL